MSHRGSVDIPQKTIEAKCLASGDAMAHFRSIPDMFYLVNKNYERNLLKVTIK